MNLIISITWGIASTLHTPGNGNIRVYGKDHQPVTVPWGNNENDPRFPPGHFITEAELANWPHLRVKPVRTPPCAYQYGKSDATMKTVVAAGGLQGFGLIDGADYRVYLLPLKSRGGLTLTA